MSQVLGRIERPPAALFQGKRVLMQVPLLPPPPDGTDGERILSQYWTQVQEQVTELESKLQKIGHVFHEVSTEAGEEGLQALRALSPGSYPFVAAKCQAGAVFEDTEDGELLAQLLDLQQCTMLPFASQEVARRLRDWYDESARKRYEGIAHRIDERLGQGEVGVLLMSEGHRVQFVGDIEVIYVSPPPLSEYLKWVERWLAEQRAVAEEEEHRETEDKPVTGPVSKLWTPPH